MRMRLRGAGIDRRTVFWALLSGVLLFLSFPKFGTGILAWIAFVPLLHALQAKKPYQGFLAGFLTGLTAYIGIIYWIAYVVVLYGYLPLPVGIALMLLLSAYLALYVAVFAAGVVYFHARGVSPILAAPLLWTSLEYAKSHLLTGFPWENLGYSQYLFAPLIQVADITGVFGISFAIVFVNVVIFDVLDAWQSRTDRKRRRRRITAEVIAGCLILLILVGYGIFRIRDVETSIDQSPQMPISLIQGNIDQSIKWRPEFQRETIRIYTNLTRQAAPGGNGLIVWPETATPFFFQEQDDMHREVAALPRLTGDWLLFGSPSYQRDGVDMIFSNSAFLLSPDGRIAGRYDKVHLVPYGEYVPLRRFFPFINKLVVGIGDFRSGPGYKSLIMHASGRPQKLGVMICYEGILPEAGRAYRQQGAGLLVNITNDAWFGNTSAPYQHLSMTTFRSVENRLYLVRAANTGISAIIDPAGRIKARSALFEKARITGMIRFMDRNTFYSTYGDVFVYGCILGLILILSMAIKKKERET
ncbi:MAG: apolipoprotein N-acyltransferase [Syntrophus sp. (in: bacteria)]|nr:apolipoprotein N-acyltransferase [Syntrophus sp. (in: bacteria)]